MREAMGSLCTSSVQSDGTPALRQRDRQRFDDQRERSLAPFQYEIRAGWA